MATQPNRLSHLQASNIYDLLKDLANAEGHIAHTPGVVSAVIEEKLDLTVKNASVTKMVKDKGLTMDGLNRPKGEDRLDNLEMRIMALEERLGVDPLS